jgi:hypothetical protein
MKTTMPSRDLTADILVPREFVWWTFLALAADPQNPFRRIQFVSRLSATSDVAIIDSRLLPLDDHLLRQKRSIAVLLWDGYQSYLQLQPAIDHVRHVAQQFELRVVGSFHELETTHGIPCRPLFPQTVTAYNKSIFSRQSLSRFNFEKPSSKLALLHRSDLLSLKAFLQLASSGRMARYRQTRLVYCGQSGIETLKSYAADYGLASDVSQDNASQREYLCAWLAAIRRRPHQWTNAIILRALLRRIALRQLAEARHDIFMNIYPDPNVNAYQAGWLFRKHTFLDFGGINGDEAVYPRAADILLHQRKTIRFDRTEALQRLQNVDSSDPAALEAFLSWYRYSILSRLDD